MLPQEPYKRFAVITLYCAVGLVITYLLFNYLWSAILPFVIAYFFAECFRPVVRYSESHKRFPKKSFVLFVVLLATASITMLIYAVARQVVLEMGELSQRIKETLRLIQADRNYAAAVIDKINSFVPFIDISDRLWEMRANLNTELLTMALSFGESAAGGLVSIIGGAAVFVPNALFTVLVVIIATYYFAIDRVRINCFFLSLFPKSVKPTLKNAKDMLAATVGKYLRAYGLLFLITFAELLASFVIIGLDFAFVLALVISLVDVLPVVGTGTVLIPWGAISLISGDYKTGIGLLISYAVITVIRQIIEPKIIGKFMGISPLATLASMYIGLKLIGIAGLFVVPLGAIVLKRVLEINQENGMESVYPSARSNALKIEDF